MTRALHTLGRWARRCWPSSLFGRIVVILVAGMLMAQMLTSSIWYDMRYGQLLEVPARLVASRLADTVRLVESMPPEGRAALLRTLNADTFRLTLSDAPVSSAARTASASSSTSTAFADTEQLIASVFAKRLGLTPAPPAALPLQPQLQLLDLGLLGDDARPAGTWALLESHSPTGRFRIQARLSDGRWLQLDALEGQGGRDPRPISALVDYLLRIYLLRIVVVVAISLVAVRLAIRPLERMAQAAETLGRDIHSPPLAEQGPREVRKAAEAFNAMQRRLIAGMAERTRFLAAVSHDLRSPITRLRLRTEFLPDKALQDKFRTDLQEMENMVNATLDFVRGIDAEDRRQHIDVNALLHSLADDWRETGADVTVTGRALQPLHGFAQSLKRCVQNLVENALRYGERAHIVVEDSAGLLRIAVRDDGPGIPATQLEQVFEPFYRLEASRNASSGGFGLGLSIARTVVAAHGGRIVLANRAEGGLEALLEFPRGGDALPA